MKNFKRILSIVISLTLLLTSIYVGGIFSVSADTVVNWDGSKTKPVSGNGTQAEPYLITNASELAYAVSTYVNAGVFYKLANDIYINDVSKDNWYEEDGLVNWIDINDGSFFGVLDGDGHKVYGLYYNKDTTVETNVTGLIAKLDKDSVVKNLGLEDSYIVGYHVGGIVGKRDWANALTATIKNCYVGEDVKITAGIYAGSIIAYTNKGYLNIENCYSLAQLEGTSIGMCADQWGGTVTVTNCYTNTNLNGRSDSTNIATTNCYQGKSGSVELDGTTTYAEISDISLDFSHTFIQTDTYPALRLFISEAEVWNGAEKEPYTDADGDGYIDITVPSQLAWVVANDGNSGGLYELLNDITLNDISVDISNGTYTNNAKTEPIEWYTRDATNAAHFTGTIEGNGFIVRGIFYNNISETTLAAGLIPSAKTLVIKNVGVEDSYIVWGTQYKTAALVGTFQKASSGNIVEQCYVGDSVYIKGVNKIGGITGGGAPSTQGSVQVKITNCYSIATMAITSSGTNYGGIIGNCWSSKSRYSINGCYTNSYFASGTDYSSCANNYAGLGSASSSGGWSIVAASNMQGENAQTNMQGLNFTTVYQVTDSYPTLRVFDKTVKKYTVKFYDYATDAEYTELEVTEDTTFADIEKPTREEYKCIGFYTDADFTTKAEDGDLVYLCENVFVKWLETPYDAAVWNGAEKEPTADSDNDGYIDITYPSELAWVIANDGNSGGNYELLNNIYLNDITVDAKNGTYINNSDTEPLQWYTKDSSTFVGTIKGNGHIVYGLFYNDSYADGSTHGKVGAGLIPYASDATITAVGIENAYIKWLSDYSTAAVVGGSHGSTIKVSIDSCYAGENVYVKSNDGAAGILGGGGAKSSGYYVKINNCYSLATLKAAGTGTVYEAGIIGNTWSSANYTVTNCYTLGKLKGNTGAFATYENNYATIASSADVSTVIAESDMQGMSAKTSMSGLDFDDTYVITDSYPELRVFHEGLQSGDNLLSAVKLSGVSLRIADISGKTIDNSSAGLRFYVDVDTTAGKYRPITDENVEYGILFETKEKLDGKALDLNTENAARIVAEELTGEGEILGFCAEVLYLSKEELDADFVVRGYMMNGEEVTYSDPQEYCAALIADKIYESTENDDIKQRIDTIFAESERFLGADAEILTFSLFSDFHYKEGMYLTSVEDMNSILDSANANNVDFIIHGGDFCNDYSGSPELTNAYLNNSYGLSAYGIYGNHELETAGNTMAAVTPLLTNRADNVVWGTSDGKIGDGSIGYYYFDKGNYRIVCTDTNYSYNSTTGEWQHNTANSYGAPSGNLYANSLGPVQLAWLESVLTDAANSGKQCVVMGHATFNTAWSGYSPDANAVCEIYNKVNAIKKGTVIMSLNGHYHTNRMMVAENVLFFDVNTTRNGYWKNGSTEHYTDEQTFQYVKYDTDGNVASTTTASLTTLSQSANTWFFEDPLSATVKISATGKITIDGVQSDWIYDVTPGDVPEYVTPEISDNTFNLWY